MRFGLDAMTNETLLELQRTVQRTLGRCLLRLQQYETLLKAMVASTQRRRSHMSFFPRQRHPDFLADQWVSSANL